jgi:LemA protein
MDKEIIKRLYAKELGLIEGGYPVVIKRRNPLQSLKESYWDRQSFAIKLAAFALFFAMMSVGVYYYNLFIVNAYEVQMQKADIEAHLQRRNDLIPNLIAAVNEYMLYEQKIFIHAADVRSALHQIEKAVNASGRDFKSLGTMEVLSKFQAVAEAYPMLKASEAYQTMMKELSDTETMIAEKRLSYNKVANYHNSRLKMIPGNVFNIIYGFKPAPTFQSVPEAKTAPRFTGESLIMQQDTGAN